MKAIRVTLAALALLALAACYPPTTITPVGTTVGFKNDTALVGLWRSLPDHDNNRTYYFHFLDGKNGEMFAVLVGGDISDVAIYKLKVARFGDIGFLNVRAMMDPKHEAPDQPKGTVPILYRFVANNRLAISTLEEDATKTAIRAHKIAGTDGTGGTDDAVITADGAALDKFFHSRAGLALFKEPFATLTKVK